MVTPDRKRGSSTSVLMASNRSAVFGLRPNCIPLAFEEEEAGGVEDRLMIHQKELVSANRL